MVASLKIPAKETWRDHFKRFLSFHKNDFEGLCLLSLDGELKLWEHHWNNSVKGLPNNLSSTLKQITFPSFPIIKRAFRILGTISVTSCTCEKSFPSWKLLKISKLLCPIITLMLLPCYMSIQKFTIAQKNFFKGM